ncbi:hypothetical protein EV363DRAFT_1396573 [Boletus edulis]|nr:hypothetical protein EV363DRAFT_1396573 [Boletus edulis]
MGDYANRHDISVAPRRYLQRQWKRNKPHLPPSDSLPVLRLCPNRPLFATKQFEANLPRARRLSAPSRTVPAPRKIRQYPRRMSAESAVSSGGPHAPKNERAFSSITTVLEAFHRDMCHDDRQLDPHHVEAVDRDTIPFSVAPTTSHNAEEETVDGGVHRVATATSMTPPLPTFSFPNVASKPEIESHKHDSEECGLKKRHRKRLPALCVQPPHTSFRASCHAAERLRLENAVTTPATDSVTSVLMEASSTPRNTGSMAVSDRGYIHSTSSIASTKNMTLLPRGSSLSPRSRSPLRESVDIYPRSTVEARQSHAVSPTSSPDLGQYYSAIRKDMSRPTSPVFSIAAPRTPSPIPPQVDYLPRGTKSLDCGDRSGIQYARELRPMSMVLSGQTPPMVGSGFSLSGEMELRMNLARWRREDAPDEPGGYHFRETGRSPKMNMKGRVKQLGRGLKELVLGRS